MTGRVTWYASRIHHITTVAPQQAFAVASLESAGLGARGVGGQGSGALAKDVSRPKPVGMMHSQVGSSLPYARIENFGGTIRAKRAPRLLIHAKRTGVTGRQLRSTFGGSVTASATEVHHRGKHYLELVVGAFPRLFVAHLRRFMPGR